MAFDFNRVIDEVIARLTTATAMELGITEAQVSIQSLNFNADQWIALIYEPVSTPFFPFIENGEPDFSIGTLEIGVYSRALDNSENDVATQARLDAIRQINDLIYVYAKEIVGYRHGLESYPQLQRIIRSDNYDSTIDSNQGWMAATQGTGMRHRVGQLIFQVPLCFD